MTNEEFVKVWELMEQRSQRVALAKGMIYGGKDRLENFKDMKELQGVDTQERSLWNVATKHIAALKNFILNFDRTDDEGSAAQWLEKITDIEVYLCRLLPAALVEDDVISLEDIPKVEDHA